MSNTQLFHVAILDTLADATAKLARNQGIYVFGGVLTVHPVLYSTTPIRRIRLSLSFQWSDGNARYEPFGSELSHWINTEALDVIAGLPPTERTRMIELLETLGDAVASSNGSIVDESFVVNLDAE